MKGLLKYKGKYRILAELDKETNDFPRDENGNVESSYDDIYISCQHGNRIMYYGRFPHKRQIWLIAYIPSLQRGHNIRNVLRKEGIEFIDYCESDSEVTFLFKDEDIELIAGLLHAKVAGANISPFSTKNLPKSTFTLNDQQVADYKELIKDVNPFHIKEANVLFLQRLENQLKKKDKTFDRVDDMKKLCMARQVKEYIAYKGFWDEYLKFLEEYLEEVENGN